MRRRSKLRAKALDMAGALLQAAPDDLDIIDGMVVHRDRPGGPSISLGDIARHLAPDSPLLGERDPGLSAEGWFRTEHMTYPYGVQIGVVRIDRETGKATVERFLLAYDIGRAINPMLVEGQLVGGLAQGIGGALSEEFVYDSRGEPLSVTLADYLLPILRDMPAVDILLTEDAPSPLNPLGIKSVGEGGITGVGAAIAAAIDDALGAARRGDPAAGDAAAHQGAAPRRQDRNAEMTGPLLTLLDAPKLAAYTAAGWWGSETLYALAARRSRETPDAFAIRDRQRRLSYAALVAAADRLASYLAGHGLRPGERVAVWLPSRVETAIALLACSRNGYVCCPSLHRDHTVDQVVELVDRMRAAAIIAQPGYGARFAEPSSDLFAALADRDFLRCALHVGPAGEPAFADLPGPAADSAGQR